MTQLLQLLGLGAGLGITARSIPSLNTLLLGKAPKNPGVADMPHPLALVPQVPHPDQQKAAFDIAAPGGVAGGARSALPPTQQGTRPPTFGVEPPWRAWPNGQLFQPGRLGLGGKPGQFMRGTPTLPAASPPPVVAPEPATPPVTPPAVPPLGGAAGAGSSLRPPKVANGFIANLSRILPQPTTNTPLGDIWGPSAAMATTAGGAYGGWKIMDMILDAERKQRSKSEVNRAKSEFQKMIQQMYAGGMRDKVGEDRFGIDALYENREALRQEKTATKGHLFEQPYVATYGRAANAMGMGGSDPYSGWRQLIGMTLAGMLATGVGTGAVAYNWTKKQDPKVLIDKALQQRAKSRMNLPGYQVEMTPG